MNIEKYIKIPGNKKANDDKKVGDGVKKMSVEIEYSDKLEDFLKYSLEEKTKIIEIGLNTYETSLEMTRNWAENDMEGAVKETRREKNKEIKKEKEKNKKHREKIGELQEKLTKMRDEMEEKIEVMRDEMKRDTDAMYKTRIETLKNEVIYTQERLNNQNGDHYNKLKELECGLRDKHENDLKAIHMKNKEELMELNDKLFTQVNNQMVSSNKGMIGENIVVEWLTKFYPLSGLEVTAKKGKKADMVLELEDTKFLIEVKNFKCNVPKRDIEKFEQEMMTIEDIDAGVFISTSSNIQGREDWEIRHYNGRPGIYLTNVSDDPKRIKGAINFLKKLIATEINVVNLGAITTTVKNFAKAQRSIITQVRNQAKDSVKLLNETLDRACDNIEKLAINLASTIQDSEGGNNSSPMM